VAVLVNRTSAGASEIVAAALKNLDRGVVIGETTAGAGTVQVLFDIASPLSPAASLAKDKFILRLTTAEFLAAGGAPIQGVGVVPDIETNQVRRTGETDTGPNVTGDELVAFAADLLAQAKNTERSKLLAESKTFLAHARDREEKR